MKINVRVAGGTRVWVGEWMGAVGEGGGGEEGAEVKTGDWQCHAQQSS